MKLKAILVAGAIFFSGTIYAQTNITLGKSVHLIGGPFFYPQGVAWVADAQTIVDGVFLPASSDWNQGPVWWTFEYYPGGGCTDDGGACSIEIDLGGTYRIYSFIFQGDSDTYFLDYWDMDSSVWQLAWEVPYTWGYVQTRPNLSDNTEKHVLSAPIITNRLRVMSSRPVWEDPGFPNTDDLNGVSEVQAFGEPYTPPPDTKFSCVGFEPPMANGPVRVKKNRVLPFKAQLLDTNGSQVTDLDVMAVPLVQVLYQYGTPDVEDVSGDALPAGKSTEGNQFFFDSDGSWHYNLKASNYSAAGIYSVFMETGDATEYLLEPTCVGTFVIQ